MTLAVSPGSLKSEVAGLKRLLKPLAKEAYLFGSFPEGTAIRNESDVDLLVVVRKPITLKSLYEKLDTSVEEFLSEGLAMHIILYDHARHPRELLETARKGMRIV